MACWCLAPHPPQNCTTAFNHLKKNMWMPANSSSPPAPLPACRQAGCTERGEIYEAEMYYFFKDTLSDGSAGRPTSTVLSPFPGSPFLGPSNGKLLSFIESLV